MAHRNEEQGNGRKERIEERVTAFTVTAKMETFAGKDDEDIDAFLERFEDMCVINDVAENKRTANLRYRMKDGAETFIRSLNRESQEDYETLKAAIVVRYGRRTGGSPVLELGQAGIPGDQE